MPDGIFSLVTATVNSLWWVLIKILAAAQLDFNDHANGHNLWVGGSMENDRELGGNFEYDAGNAFHMSARGTAYTHSNLNRWGYAPIQIGEKTSSNEDLISGLWCPDGNAQMM